MCVFELPETVLNLYCHFTALVSNVCYLGNFMAERTVLADKVSADLHIKKCMFVQGPAKKTVPRLREFCSCCCLPLLPGLA